MFSGIVERTGRVAAIRSGAGATRLTIDAGDLFAELAPGASVAINGVCLTLVAKRETSGEFDVVPETLRRTDLGRLQPGDRVNLERSLRVGDRIDGHMVQGHVDGVGRVQHVDRNCGEWKLWFETDEALMPFIVPKGSIALDGVSLTLVDVNKLSFSVALIPATLDRTTLSDRAPGDAINIETDILARIAVRRIDALLAGRSERPTAHNAPSGVTWEQLQAAGYLK